jgi:hypothetical protein
MTTTGGVTKRRLICLVRRHQWHNGWDEERYLTIWTCKRCGATGVPSDEMGTLAGWTQAGVSLGYKKPLRWIP